MVSQNDFQSSENTPNQSSIEVAARLADPTQEIDSGHYDAMSCAGDIWKCHVFNFARHILGIPFWHDILYPVRDPQYKLGEPEHRAIDFALQTWLKVHFDANTLDGAKDHPAASDIGLDWVSDTSLFDELRNALARVETPRVNGDFWGFAVSQAERDFSRGYHSKRIILIRDKLGIRSPFQILALHIMEQCAKCYDASGAGFPVPQGKLADALNEIALKNKDTFKGRSIDQSAVSQFLSQLTKHGFFGNGEEIGGPQIGRTLPVSDIDVSLHAN